ncbi:MAG: hypothetical protein QW761_00110, partial [Candidatus Aenigmatarchaeota archaeon]
MVVIALISILNMSSNPQHIEHTIEVECVEINHVWDIQYNDGKAPDERWSWKRRLTQTIGWKWDANHSYHVDWWTWEAQYPID